MKRTKSFIRDLPLLAQISPVTLHLMCYCLYSASIYHLNQSLALKLYFFVIFDLSSPAHRVLFSRSFLLAIRPTVFLLWKQPA